MDVSEYLIVALRDQGVGCIFMDPGGLNDHFMVPMTTTEGLRTVVAAFEGGAAYMADGYARASGGLGACFAIGGPGVMNMTTALAAALADRSTVIAISGEVARSWEGLGGFQDASGAAIDDVGVLKPVTGLSISVPSEAVVAHHLRHAITHAFSERKPVHLSVPVDVQTTSTVAEWRPVPEALSHPRFIDERSFEHFLSLLSGPDASRNVVILAGVGVVHAGASRLLLDAAERFDIPVATTLAGKGVMDEEHDLALGVFGYGGSRWAIDAVRDDAVEVLVVVGSGLSQRDTMQWDLSMLPSKALVHVETDPLLIGRTWASDVPLLGDAATFLERLAALDGDAAAGLERGRTDRRRFLDRTRSGGTRVFQEEDTRSEAVPMHPARVVAELRAACPDDTVLCVDSGAHRAWFAEYWSVRQPGTHFSLTNLAPMGGAIPLGIGAKLAQPDRPLVVATGDGCMLMHGMELHTAAREEVPIIVALMDNESYGNIWFRAHGLGPGPERLTDITGMDWVGFARSVGAAGERVEHPGEIAGAVARALDRRQPTLLDLRVEKAYLTPVSPWRERQKAWEDHE
jgi:acetolactate synthase I/II/III large subunit